MYKTIDELPITFGPTELAGILGISRNKASALVRQPDFPKYRVGKRIIISKKHSPLWMDAHFGRFEKCEKVVENPKGREKNISTYKIDEP